MSYLCGEGHLVREQIQISNCPTCRAVARRADSRKQRRLEESAPFFAGRYAGTATFYCDAASRLEHVKTMNRNQLMHAQGAKGLQKAVRVAIERRLKKIAEGT